MQKQIDWQICTGLETQCYRNLNNGLISLRQKVGNSWLVVGHTDRLVLKNPRFHVSEASRQRVLVTRNKSVHAWAYGVLGGNSLESLPALREIDYCPYTLPFFTWRGTEIRIERADLLVVIDNRVFCTTESALSQLTLF
jgi:hypothetical protein